MWMLRVRYKTFLFVALSAQDIKNLSCKCSPEYQSMLPINQNCEKKRETNSLRTCVFIKKKKLTRQNALTVNQRKTHDHQ